jgi:hypothetical protein
VILEKGLTVNSVKILGLGVIGLLAVVLTSCAPSGVATKDELQLIDPVMGDWRGHRVAQDGEVLPLKVQVIALGNRKYHFVLHALSGETGTSVDSLDATLEGKRLLFSSKPDWQVVCENGSILGRTSGDASPFLKLNHFVRLSPALGAQPPAGALRLFDGTSLAAWQRRDPKQRDTPVGWKVADGAMEVVPGTGDIVTKQAFKDFQMHLEFRTPFMPEAREQARGNSGVYLQGRYEVQVLDSYGLKGEDNECGGIYKLAAPRMNMCAPPGQWQTYDVTFHAPRFDVEGKKVKDAVVTVMHNGVAIHEDLDVPEPTAGGVENDVQLPGGILLQDHGNLVQYRNIWLVELKN